MTILKNDAHPSRRSFLCTGAAAGAGLMALPLLPRRAFAGPAAASRLLVFNLTGALRSSAAFLAAADGDTAQNPWGVIPGTGTAFALGRLLDDNLPAGHRLYQAARDGALPPAAYQLGPNWGMATVPRLRDMAARFSVLGTWNAERGDHIRARIEEVTGASAGSEPGLLTRIGRALESRTNESPAFHLMPAAAFGLAPGVFSAFAPVGMAGPQSLPSSATLDPALRASAGNGFGDEPLRTRLDQTVIARRAAFGKQMAEAFAVHRRSSRRMGARLAEPWLQVGPADPYTPMAVASQGEVQLPSGKLPLTNEMLYELVVRALGPDPADPARIRPLPAPNGSQFHEPAVNTALGIRLLQLGSPAVVVEVGNFDLHSGEVDTAPVLYRFLGRLWASVAWLLERIPDPAGGTMLDHTLMVTMSDFSRDRGSATTGFNGGDGSDHGNDPCCYYLAHAIMGAGVTGGRLVGGVRTDTFDASREARRVSPRHLLAGLLASLGVDHRDPLWGFEDAPAENPIGELWKA